MFEYGYGVWVFVGCGSSMVWIKNVLCACIYFLLLIFTLRYAIVI